MGEFWRKAQKGAKTALFSQKSQSPNGVEPGSPANRCAIQPTVLHSVLPPEPAQAGLLAHTLCSYGGVRGSAPRWVAQGAYYLKLYVLFVIMARTTHYSGCVVVNGLTGQGDNRGSIPGTVFFDFCHIQAPKTPISGSCLQKEC